MIKGYCYGVYYYFDLIKNEIVYIGRDSHINYQKRNKDHLNPSNYNAQPFNRVLQNNPARYKHFVFRVCETFEEMIEIEDNLINLYRPKFNFKFGKDETPLRGPTYNVIKDGRDENNNQNYGIYGKNSKRIIKSVDKEFLEELSSKLKNNELTEEDIKQMDRTEYSVCKNGFTKQGKQTYAINKNHNCFLSSVDKEFLEMLCDKLNNNEISLDYIVNTHSRTIKRELAL